MKVDWLKIKNVVDGNSTEEEVREICEWAENGEQEQQFLEDARKFYEEKRMPDFDSSKAWERVGKRTIDPYRKRRIIRRVVLSTISVASAVIVLYFGIRHDFLPKKVVMAESQECGLARIVMSDGRVYGLDEIKSQTIDGIEIKANHIIAKKGSSEFEKTEYGEIIIPRGKTYTLTLPDGSEVLLNANSRLKFPLAFTEDERRVQLVGEAYFDVVKCEEKPFIVELDSSHVRVLGTKFNIKSRSHENIYTTLVEGKVLFENKRNSVTITKGEMCIMNASSGNCEVLPADIEGSLAWIDEEFIFKEKSLDFIFNELSHWYSIKVKYDSPEIKNECFHLYLKRSSSIEEILSNLSLTGKIKYTQKGEIITIYSSK